MDRDVREKAAKTAVDGFIVVERIYRHAYQTVTALKEKLKDELNLKVESPLYSNNISTADPKSWIFQFRGLYLANKKVFLEEYRKGEIPIFFLQASLFNPNDQEPVLRYGVIKKIFNITTWKGARFDDYFKMTIAQLHTEPKSSEIKASHCEATLESTERFLLDIKEDKDIVALVDEITDKYANLLLA
jgi:hypothetical protein